MNKYTIIKAGLIIITLGSMVLFLMSSCSGNKYGCGHGHPKQTWKKMVRKINSP